jgi:hypothetical protein
VDEWAVRCKLHTITISKLQGNCVIIYNMDSTGIKTSFAMVKPTPALRKHLHVITSHTFNIAYIRNWRRFS